MSAFTRTIIRIAVFSWIAMLPAVLLRGGDISDYNVSWESPSVDHSGSMPLGNGDIGLNAWIEENGDLAFYIGKTDAWGDNARLLKVGKVRVRLNPPLHEKGNRFLQELDLAAGMMKVSSTGESGNTHIALWADANHPVIHVTFDSDRDVTATASIELWRTERQKLPSLECSDIHLDRSKPDQKHAPTFVEPDIVLKGQRNRIGWYHHNAKSVGPELTARIQGLPYDRETDPLLHRTFGAIIKTPGGVRIDDKTLRTAAGKTGRIDICVLTRHPASPEQWLGQMDSLIAGIDGTPFRKRKAAHEKWWAGFWGRSWIRITKNSDEAASIIPGNTHCLRAGEDQNEGNRFRGEIARITLFGSVLGNEKIAGLAAGDRKPLAATGDTIAGWYGRSGSPGVVLEELKPPASLTIEAWIKTPEKPGGGARIVDKITPGGSDGFLLDTHPGNGLRLIVGHTTLTGKECLAPGQWHHVAGTIDSDTGKLRLFLDGKTVAEAMAAPGDDAFVLSRAYHLQRYINACAGRGRYPIKFNGSIFTVPHAGKPGDADYRRWGPGYWWQNTRLPYISMCASGDFDLMQPFFRMYIDDVLPVCVERTRSYFDHGGAYFPECIYFWGAVFSESYGWQPVQEREDPLQTSGWHKWEWVSGLELVWMMLDYYEHTTDEAFLKEKLLPAAREILLFFEEHHETSGDGKLVLHPSQALETWWDCTNPMCEVAGLHAVIKRLLALPDGAAAPDQRKFWRTLHEKLPPLPVREVDGVSMFAPAERFESKRNIENPELYAVFPFRLASFEKPNADLAIGALRNRWDRGSSGWRQDDIFMAYLGLAEEARDNVVARARKSHAGSRFPAFWGPNYDWIPDQDHGGILLKAAQAMLMQTEGRKILLLPAWPKEWDAEFKLHTPRRTVVQGRVEKGKLSELSVTPEARRADVIINPSFR